MKVHDNAQVVIDWLTRAGQASLAEIRAAGVMRIRDAKSAVDYAVRHGSLEKCTHPHELGVYRTTGKALPAPKSTRATPPTFDLLLQAWGITRTPPTLMVSTSLRRELADD